MLSKEIPIDTNDPMNGLVTFLKGEKEVVSRAFLTVKF